MSVFEQYAILPKSLSAVLIAVMIANIVLFGLIFQPKPAEAQLAVAVVADAVAIVQWVAQKIWDAAKFAYEKVVDAKNTLYEYWDQFKSAHGTIAEITSTLFLVIIHQVLAKITNDIVVWINGGGKGKIRVMQDPGKFLRDSVDEAGGVLMGAILNVDPKTLCDASFLKQKLAITFAGPYAVPTFDEKVACTFSGMAEGLRKFREDFRNGGWHAFIEYTQKQNNQIGLALIVQEELENIKKERSAEAVAKLQISKGFLAQEKCTVTLGPRGSSDHPWVGKDIDEAFTMAQAGGYSFSNDQEFMGWLVVNGGKYNCKTVTPAEQISDLASTALQAPIKKMESALTALTNKLGTGMGSVLKPYVLAIGNASLNLLLKKEKGLVNDLFAAPNPKRDRNERRFPSDTVQQNAMQAGSAGQLASSANDFRSFIFKSLVDFSIFVNTSAQVMDESDELGRLPLNKAEYARVFNKASSGNPITDGFLNMPPNLPNITDNYDPTTNKSIGKLRGWLTDVDCEAAVSNTASLGPPIIPIDPNKPFATVISTSSVPFGVMINASSTTSIFQVRVATCGDMDGNITNGIQLGPTAKMTTTYPSGKILFEEAQWCGAYSQETSLPVTSSEAPLQPYATGTDYAMYDDDNDAQNVLDRFTRVNNGFTETLIIPNSDVNHSNALESTTTTNILLTMTPKFSGEIRSINGATSAPTIPIAQPAAAQGFIFGGYNSSGFSSDIRTISSNSLVANLPIALAGTEAVYYPPNGRVYIFGGRNEQGYSSAVYEFTPAGGQIRTMSARFPKGIYGTTGAYSPDTQRIYLFGGKMGDARLTTGGTPPVLITEAFITDQIFEFNQQTDTITAKSDRLPAPIAHSSAVPANDGASNKIYIFGGMDSYGQAVGDILAFDPRAASNALKIAGGKIQPRGYLAALPVNASTIRIFGGETSMGRLSVTQNYNALTDQVTSADPSNSLTEPLSQMGRSWYLNTNGSLSNQYLAGGIKNSPAGNPGAMIFPQGDIYYIPGGAPAISKSQPVLQKFYSPTYEGGSVSLLNIREDIAYKDPTLTVLNPDIKNELRDNGDEVYLPEGSFYPELNEKIQELMEKLRIIKGYHYKTPNIRDYEAGLGQQVGSVPDDYPYDNSSQNPLYHDRSVGISELDCLSPNVWDETSDQCLIKGYKGSVSDVVTKYKNIAEAYQTLYSGVTDEHALEGLDLDMTILTPTETNLKLALIGKRCPSLPPSATSTPDIAAGCPSFGQNGEYNMAKRFIFEADDTRQNPTGLTTGFATNPFNDKKSSSIAGILNLDEMATQLQAMPPDKNIIKLIRLRQILEQLQVAPIRPIAIPGSSASTSPDALVGVDIIQTSLFGFEKIQDWLNATTTKNKDIQELIEAYGYTNAKEAYPEISKDLDTALQDAINQVTDKTREVFLKRTEKELELAKLDAQYRLKRFIEYAMDLNTTVKLGMDGDSARRLFGSLIDSSADQVDDDMYVLRTEPFTSSVNNPHWINNVLKQNPAPVDNNERGGLIGSAVYKIKTLAKFIGLDTNSIEFNTMMTHYTNPTAQAGDPDAINADVDARLKDAATDVYLLFRGISDQTDPNLSQAEKNRTSGPGGRCVPNAQGYECTLTATGANNQPVKIYKDATTKLKELENDFGLMMEEFSKIKDEFSQTISDSQGQKQQFEDLLAKFSAMKAAFNQANACVGMPDIKWQPPSAVSSAYSAIGATAALSLAAVSVGYLTGVAVGAYLLSAAAIPVIGIIALAIFGFISASKRKKAEKKRQAAIQKAVNSCISGLNDYNLNLGQLADSFICGRTNPIYQE